MLILIGKTVGLIVFGAILTLPVHVMFGTFLAPWKVRERSIMLMSSLFAYAVVLGLIFGYD